MAAKCGLCLITLPKDKGELQVQLTSTEGDIPDSRQAYSVSLDSNGYPLQVAITNGFREVETDCSHLFNSGKLKSVVSS